MTSKQSDTPLFSKIMEHIYRNPTPFHIPGHKQGKGVDPAFREFIGKNAFLLDLINISPLDNLHQPTQAIKHAQELAAEAFEADHSFFSVQGTTNSILTMILSACTPGDKIIVPRNIHKSVLSAIILADAIPIFVQPEMDHKLSIAHHPTAKQVEKMIRMHPDSKAIFLIHPTYYGVAGNLERIVQLAHQHQMVVLVDEAHGILHSFHDKLPTSAMASGADMAATSMHKLGGALTQSSILNLKSKQIHPDTVQAMMNMLTTTSTSYLLLASLDTQRRYLALYGHDLIERTLQLSQFARNQINQIPGLYCPDNNFLSYKSVYEIDRTKLLIHLEQLSISGQEAETWLRENHQIEVELSDQSNLLCLVTIGDTEKSIHKLITALQDLSSLFYQSESRERPPIHLPDLPQLVMTPREAFYHKKIEIVPLEQSVNRIIAETVTIYPPGIPVLLPGERISTEHITYIQESISLNLPVQATTHPSGKYLRVI